LLRAGTTNPEGVKMKTPPLPLPRAAVLFRLLGDECRLRLLLELAEHGPRSGTELVAALGKTQVAVSRHLALLRGAEVVRSRREGKTHVYSLAADRVRGLLRMVRREDGGALPRRKGGGGGSSPTGA